MGNLINLNLVVLASMGIDSSSRDSGMRESDWILVSRMESVNCLDGDLDVDIGPEFIQCQGLR